MNCVGFGFSVMIVIFAICHKSGSRSDYRLVPQQSEVSDTFASLLHSLVKVNEERVKALNKFFKLNDFQAASQKFLRTGDERKEDGDRVLAFILVNVQPDKTFDKIPYLTIRKSDSDSDASSESSSDSDDRKDDKNLINNIKRKNFKFRDIIKTDPDSSHEVKSTENWDLVNNTDLVIPDTSSEEDHFVKVQRSTSMEYLPSTQNYLNCVTACKEAYRNACSYYECSRRLYRQLRKECRYSCHSKFDYRSKNK